MLILQTTCETQKSSPGGMFFFFSEAARLFPKSWSCQKQTDVSHSSTEAAIVSSDVCPIFEAILALTLWDLVIAVSGPPARRESSHNTKTQKRQNLSQEANGEDTAALPMRQLSGVMSDFQ